MSTFADQARDSAPYILEHLTEIQETIVEAKRICRDSDVLASLTNLQTGLMPIKQEYRTLKVALSTGRAAEREVEAHHRREKRNGALHGFALISALEKLAGEVVDLVNEGKKPVGESIAHVAREMSPGITGERATAIATALISEAAKVCFPNWHLKSDVKSALFLGITTVLVQQFKGANLHMPATGFAERVVHLLEKTRFVGNANEVSAS